MAISARRLRNRDGGADACAAAGRAVDDESAVESGETVGEAAQPRPAAGVGAADAVVADLDQRVPVLPGDTDARLEAFAYLATFVNDSATT